jgi:SAM-dependent methyltransferase
VPRIRASIAQRGIFASLCRSVLLPWHLLREYRAARALRRGRPPSEFDVAHGVETDGDFDDWTYLSDLDIASPNWIHGRNYSGIEPDRFAAVMASVAIKHQDFVFMDFGSGKGRALLMASEFPFRRVIGIEFAPVLHAIAEKNIRIYPRGAHGCDAIESVCCDFLEFELPPEPSVLFFFDPCNDVLFPQLLDRIRDSLFQYPRPVHLIFVAAGRKEALLDTADFLVKLGRNAELQFCWYPAKMVCKE